MKWFFILAVLVATSASFFMWALGRPGYYYGQILEGKDPIPEYFKGAKIEDKLLMASDYKMNRDLVLYEEQEKYWKTFHLSHFELEVPYDHPLYYPVPIVEPTNFSPNLGISFYDSLGKFIMSFTVLSPFPFKYFSPKDKVFNFPATENYLNTLDRRKIWEDLFSLSIPKNCQSSCGFYRSIYYLYLIRLRQEYLPEPFSEITYFKEKEAGIILEHQNSQSFNEETVYYLQDNIVYPLKLRIQKNNPQAEVTRRRLLKSFRLRPSQIDDRVSIFAEFQALPSSEQKSIKAIYFLFSAWTHDQENENYFKLLIKNLESFKPQDQSYHPLYEFSFKKFGSTFSRYGDTFKETMDRKLKRKIEEELEVEINSSKKIEFKAPVENFKSESEKQDYYLKQSKEEKIKDEENELTID